MSAIEDQQDEIGVKEAIRIAREELAGIEENRMYNLRLEEVRYDDDHSEWLVTFGYDVAVEELPDPRPSHNALGALFAEPRSVRVYRVIVLDAFIGRFKELRMRDSASAR